MDEIIGNHKTLWENMGKGCANMDCDIPYYKPRCDDKQHECEET